MILDSTEPGKSYYIFSIALLRLQSIMWIVSSVVYTDSDLFGVQFALRREDLNRRDDRRLDGDADAYKGGHARRQARLQFRKIGLRSEISEIDLLNSIGDGFGLLLGEAALRQSTDEPMGVRQDWHGYIMPEPGTFVISIAWSPLEAKNGGTLVNFAPTALQEFPRSFACAQPDGAIATESQDRANAQEDDRRSGRQSGPD